MGRVLAPLKFFASEDFKMSDYVLESTKDKRDRSREIEEMLSQKGVCILGSGDFFVSGIKMPDRSTIKGMGAATRLILSEEVSEGAAITLASFCTVREISISGAEADIDIPQDVGSRHGILFAGNATEKHFSDPQPKHGIISSCFISSFSGGGITCDKTGYSPASSLTVSDCHIFRCGAGINVSDFSEYHEFTNVLCVENRYGCINNGGNNVFVNCGFNCNITAFLMDNSKGDKNNNSHGSVVGCTFNHSDKNNGIGIYIRNTRHGYVFTGCQLFFSKIIIENSTKLVFNSFNTGRNVDIIIKGKHATDGGLITFNNFACNPMPRIMIEDNDTVKFTNCYNNFGEPVVI